MSSIQIEQNLQMTSAKHFSIHFTKLDVTVKEDWVRAWNEAEEFLGGKIEILCNNAGVPPRVRSLFSMVEYKLSMVSAGRN